jgi:DNA ligase 1
MRLSEVVAVSGEVAQTSARSAKIEILSGLLRRLDPSEVEAAAGFLTGAPRQGKVGVGWRTVYGIEAEGAPSPSIEIAELDAAIGEFASASGAGSNLRRREVLGGLLERATPEEADFIRRLFTGEMRQGALEGVMTEAVAKAAEVSSALVRRALMLSGKLPLTASLALAGGAEALRAVGLEVFRPVRPMLASTAEDVEEAMSGLGEASVEWKLDGIRIQVHRRGSDVRIFSRGLHDITEAVPGVARAMRGVDASSAVLDGEAIGLGPDERPLAFQDSLDDATKVRGFLFDVLHLDGEDLIDLSLDKRLGVLRRVAPDLSMPGAVTSDVSQARAVLEEALEHGHEGAVVKALDSTYVAGRRGKAWRKVKRHHTYDLVVLGPEWGHRRRQGWLSNLHLGARDPQSGSLMMVGKCFKGLTDELLKWQTEALLERETSREGIVVWVRPELVVEIAIDGVQTSTRYPGGIALRFARVRRYRPDKSPDQADSIATLQALRSA